MSTLSAVRQHKSRDMQSSSIYQQSIEVHTALVQHVQRGSVFDAGKIEARDALELAMATLLIDMHVNSLQVRARSHLNTSAPASVRHLGCVLVTRLVRIPSDPFLERIACNLELRMFLDESCKFATERNRVPSEVFLHLLEAKAQRMEKTTSITWLGNNSCIVPFQEEVATIASHGAGMLLAIVHPSILVLLARFSVMRTCVGRMWPITLVTCNGLRTLCSLAIGTAEGRSHWRMLWKSGSSLFS
mmetsp:Transcript_4465/g.8088  ORF Transcript_4465/g.8088 Transcript_4465/m.8088 type:complete len:245 (+) Transcript_4465:64-798(+)